MATLKEFKKWLEQFPEDTIVRVAVQQGPSALESHGPVKFEDFQIPTEEWGDGFEFSDFRNNRFTSPNSPWFGKCLLELGEAQY